MRRSILLLSLIAGIFLLPSQVLADHMVGSDIKWSCLGNDKFEVTVTVYRDCNGIPMYNSPMQFSGNCAGLTNSSQSMSAGKDITPVCPGQCTRCKSGGCSFQYGIEAYELTTVIDVKQFKKNGCCEITVSFTQCCRSSTIDTGAHDGGFYVQATMNVCQTPCDNSPTFTGDPLAIICLGRDFIFNQGAQDKDVNSKDGSRLDSLVFSFADPLASASQKNTWTSPYTSQKPLKYLGFPNDYSIDRFPYGFHLDSVTGDMMFRPMRLNQTIMTIKVEEYRNGKKIGETRRDMQITIIKCPSNNPPVISGINCSKPVPVNFKTDACANEKLCFNICTSDKDRDDTVTIGWNAGITGATFKVLNPGQQRENGQFCWTPTESHAMQNPPIFRFVVDAKDNACPVNGFAGRTFTIRVKLPPKAIYDTLVTKCGQVKFKAEKRGTIPIAQYLWSMDGVLFVKKGGDTSGLDYKFKHDGPQPFALTLVGSNGCNVTLQDTVTIPEYVFVEGLKDTIVCPNTDIKFSSYVQNNFGNYFLGWRADTGLLDTLVTRINYNSGANTSKIILNVKDSVCENADTIFITVNHPSKLAIGKDQRICAGDAYNFKPNITAIDSTLDTLSGKYIPDEDSIYTYAWYKNGFNKKVGSGRNLSATDSATYLLSIKDSLGCETLDSVELKVNPKRNWKPQPLAICQKQSAVLKPKEKVTVSHFKWWSPAIHDTLTSKIKPNSTADSFIVKPSKTTNYGVRWTETVMGLTCTAYDSVKVSVNDITPASVSPLPYLCVDANDYVLFKHGLPNIGQGGTGEWYDDDINLDKVVSLGNSYRFRPSVAGADGQAIKKHQLFYVFTNANGCKDTANGFISVKPLPIIELTENSTTMCTNEVPRNLDDYIIQGQGGIWKWENPNGSTAQPIYQKDLNGDGTAEWLFDVKDVKQGEQILSYYYEDTKLNPQPYCSNEVEFKIDVVKVPEVETGKYDSVCVNAKRVTFKNAFPPSDSKGQGTWYYNGTDGQDRVLMSSNTISPQQYGALPEGQFHYFTYHYQVIGTQCWAEAKMPFQINALPIPNITNGWPSNAGGQDRICETKIQALKGNTTENGKTYTSWEFVGQGVQSLGNGEYQFNAAKVEADNSIEVRLAYGVQNIWGCVDTVYKNVVVDVVPEVSFTNSDVCLGDEVELKAEVKNGSILTWSTTGDGTFSETTMAETNYTPGQNDSDPKKDEFEISISATNEFTDCPAGISTKSLRVFAKPSIFPNLNDTMGCSPFQFELNPYLANIPTQKITKVAHIAFNFGDSTPVFKTGDTSNFLSHTYGETGTDNADYEFSIVATSDKGCVSKFEQTILTLSTPKVDFRGIPNTASIINPLVQFRNNTQSSHNIETNFYWDFGNVNDLEIVNEGINTSTEREPKFKFADTGTYQVFLIASQIHQHENRIDSCIDTIMNPIRINDEIRMFIPTAFSPDGENTIDNERWKPVTTATEHYNVKVYDRWGQLVWESSDPNDSWDGTNNGTDVPVGVYVYLVTAKSIDGSVDFDFTGTVTILR